MGAPIKNKIPIITSSVNSTELINFPYGTFNDSTSGVAYDGTYRTFQGFTGPQDPVYPDSTMLSIVPRWLGDNLPITLPPKLVLINGNAPTALLDAVAASLSSRMSAADVLMICVLGGYSGLGAVMLPGGPTATGSTTLSYTGVSWYIDGVVQGTTLSGSATHTYPTGAFVEQEFQRGSEVLVIYLQESGILQTETGNVIGIDAPFVLLAAIVDHFATSGGGLVSVSGMHQEEYLTDWIDSANDCLQQSFATGLFNRSGLRMVYGQRDLPATFSGDVVLPELYATALDMAKTKSLEIISTAGGDSSVITLDSDGNGWDAAASTIIGWITDFYSL